MKKNIIIVVVLLLIGSLVACNTLSFSSNTTTGQRNNAAAAADPTKLSVEAKTGIGILELEGTDNAVDADQAEELLPLFMALKTLSTNNNTAVAEITALNKQIQTTLTADQLSAIQNMTFTSADIRALMETNGLLDTATTGTSSRTSAQGGGFGGPPDGGGIPGMGGPGGGTTTTSRTVATPNAAASALSARKTAGGLNLTFVEPIIKLLQSKIGK